MPIQIQLRHGTAAAWTAADPTLALGEVGAETDTNKFKVGDGATSWSVLSYSVGGTGAPGTNGTNGTNGVGVPTGGTIAQVLTKLSSTNYDTDWETPATGFTNPMTTAADLIVGDTGGAPVRLAKGADGTVLTVDPTTHLLVWATPGGGSVPVTTKGDLFGYSTAAARIPVGSDAQVLTADSTQALGLKWAAAGGGGTDLVQVASGAGSIIIPGLSGSIDIRVAGANDDEFDTTDTTDPMTGWTTIGTPTAHNMNSTKKSHYYLSKTQGGAIGVHGIQKASPALPFTVTAQVVPVTQDGNSRAGLMVGEATPGKMLSVAWDGSVPNAAVIHVDTWASPTGYGASISTSTKGPMPYLRLICTSSTAVQAQCSLDGYIWFNVGTSINPGFTIASAGLIVNQATTGAFVTYLTSDWIRFT